MAKQIRRAYKEIRSFIEQHGGTMTFQRVGYQYGAWIVRYNGKEKAFPSHGGSFPGLDELYVPKTANPRHYNDYSNTLIAGAWNKLVASL